MFYIRADANEVIGTGHIMRCLAVAVELRKNLEEVVFIVADQYGQGIVESYGFKTLCLHSQWDNLEMELGIILPLVKENHVRGILVDSYYVTENYLAKLHQCTRLIYIDDVNAFIYPVDLLVNYNIYAEKIDYFKRYMDAELDTGFLLGCSYVPLRYEFCNIKSKSISRIYQQEKTGDKNIKILVTSGGADVCNITGSLLEKLKDMDWFSKTEFHVILGRFHQHKRELYEKWIKCPNVCLHENIKYMSEYMSMCDVAVTAGGSTVYELCACGLPSVIYTIADNQLGIAREFDARGLVPWCGDARYNTDVCIEHIIYNLENLLRDYEFLKKKSIELQMLVDGYGAARIAEKILQYFI